MCTCMQTMKILARNNVAPYSKKLSFTIEKSVETICEEIDKVIENHKINRGKIIAINKKLTTDNTEENKNIKNKLEEEKNKLEELRSTLEMDLDKYKYSVLEDIKEKYIELGYTVNIQKLKVSNFGGYTNRIRLIIVAVRNDIKKKWELPNY